MKKTIKVMLGVSLVVSFCLFIMSCGGSGGGGGGSTRDSVVISVDGGANTTFYNGIMAFYNDNPDNDPPIPVGSSAIMVGLGEDVGAMITFVGNTDGTYTLADADEATIIFAESADIMYMVSSFFGGSGQIIVTTMDAVGGKIIGTFSFADAVVFEGGEPTLGTVDLSGTFRVTRLEDGLALGGP